MKGIKSTFEKFMLLGVISRCACAEYLHQHLSLVHNASTLGSRVDHGAVWRDPVDIFILVRCFQGSSALLIHSTHKDSWRARSLSLNVEKKNPEVFSDSLNLLWLGRDGGKLDHRVLKA